MNKFSSCGTINSALDLEVIVFGNRKIPVSAVCFKGCGQKDTRILCVCVGEATHSLAAVSLLKCNYLCKAAAWQRSPWEKYRHSLSIRLRIVILYKLVLSVTLMSLFAPSVMSGKMLELLFAINQMYSVSREMWFPEESVTLQVN